MNLKRTFAIVVILCLLFLVYFFRKPPITLRPTEQDVIRSPAYGRVMKIHSYPGDYLFVAIFLSPFDIHYQVSPVNGVVERVDYDPTGKFELAYDYNKSADNEKAITTIRTSHGSLRVYQIAGFLVRRIVTYVEPRDRLISGQLMGLIKFGSRVDLLIPEASSFNLNVQENDYVSGSDTIIGHYNNQV